MFSSLDFQDVASPIMGQLQVLHDSIVFFILLSATAVFWLFYSIISSFTKHREHQGRSIKQPSHSVILEWILTALPCLILLAIALPSFRLLYLMDDSVDAVITVKAIGQQWYWSFEWSDFSEWRLHYLILALVSLSMPKEILRGELAIQAVLNQGLQVNCRIKMKLMSRTHSLGRIGKFLVRTGKS